MVRFLAIALALVIAMPWPAGADDAGASAGAEYFNAWLRDEHPASSGGAAPASQANSVTYSYDPQCSRGDGGAPAFYGCGEQAACGDEGLLYNVWATTPSGQTSLTGTWCDEPDQAAPTNVLTPGRILEAFESIPLPEAPLEVQPPGGVTLVNFDTILHTEAQPFTETVQLLNRQIAFDIEPSEFTWTLGDGRTLTTTDPGRAWRAGLPMNEYVSYRYAKAGTVRLQLTTTWSARWRLPNGPWRPVVDTVEITSPPQQLEVTTARPQLVSYD